MNKRNCIRILMGCLVLMGCQGRVKVVVVDDENAEEVAFEDVATNVRVVPLVSEEPIGSIRNMICYGNEIVALDNNKKTVYYFEDGKLVSKMNHEGRGRGEDVEIRRYAYSHSRKVVYVLADDKILWYSVPQMRYCGNTAISKKINYFSIHDNDHFFAALYSEGMFITALIDIETGNITKVLEEITMNNADEGDISMSSYSPSNHYYSLSDYDNSVVEVTAKDEARTLFKYNFGDKGIPAKYLQYDPLDMQPLADLFSYMDENGRTRLQGNQFLRIKDDEISFWYYFSVGSGGIKYYYRYNLKDNKSTNLKGFRIKGINRPVMPSAVSDNGYIAIFAGNPGWYKMDEETSPLAESIIQVMENQKDNNPVLLFYDIK